MSEGGSSGSSRSRHLVDPELVDLLAALPAREINLENLKVIRDTRRGPTQGAPDARAIEVAAEVHQIPAPRSRSTLTLRSYRPLRGRSPFGCILHIHGGGFVAGSGELLETSHRQLCAELRCAVVSVDYRLAPETVFPGNLEDCYAALSWIFERATAFDVDPQRIGVMGESAGGGLAAALALLARDRSTYSPAFQHLVCPMLDDRTCVCENPHPFTGEFVWTAGNNHFGWSSLLGSVPGAQNVSAYAAPARATDLAGLPPTFISTSQLDLFLEEDIEYARRLLRAGVSVELHVYPGAFHGFELHPTARVARAARDDSMSALRRFVGERV